MLTRWGEGAEVCFWLWRVVHLAPAPPRWLRSNEELSSGFSRRNNSLSGKRVQKCTHWPEGSQMSLQRAVEANRVFVGTMKKTKSTDNGVVNTIR